MGRFMFITEDSHGVRHNGNDAGNRQSGSGQVCTPSLRLAEGTPRYCTCRLQTALWDQSNLKIEFSFMEHLICRVEGFEIVAPYTIRVDFDDSTRQVIDFLPVLRGELYGPLRDLALFNRVSLDAEAYSGLAK
jgi:hypothetical protein